MIINFEELKASNYLEISFIENYENRDCTDALIQSVNKAEVSLKAYLIDEIDVHLSLEVSYDVNYLDAINLDELLLVRKFEEEVLFTSNQARADEMDIDLFDKEIDISDLVFQLILVDIPFNYTEQIRNPKSEEEITSSYNPFADL